MSESESRTLTVPIVTGPNPNPAPVILTHGPAGQIGVAAPIVAATKKGNRRGTARLETFRVIIRRAATKAGKGKGTVLVFCQLLDFDGVPVDPEWGVKDWRSAYKRKLFGSAIRGMKSRFSA
jgi:hypothetical protein